ncbi:hypothetical protein HED55_22860 [Ochrobactrum haematophilum]|uniref:Outer membrane autotransporter n=1 Tax=Brucella haematophila TaxID=419474 RepID=A0ABX1DR95_9HYPH|nr:hypothetical protein [Brucella haematophila]
MIGAADGAGTVVMDVKGALTSSDATITVAYGRLANGNGTLGSIVASAFATRVASGATLDLSTFSSTIRNLQDTTPGSGGTVSWTSNPLYVYGGSFSGQFESLLGGELVKDGADTLLLNGDNYAFSGTTTVANGKLIVGDVNNSSAALGGNITVLSGAILGGYGSVGETTVQSGGILSPGNSIGILTVDGNLTLQPGSALEVEIAANGASNRRSDIVGVTGMATISGSTVSVTAIDPQTSYQSGQNYTILHADSGINGTFGSVISRSAFLDLSVNYSANDVLFRDRRQTRSHRSGTIQPGHDRTRDTWPRKALPCPLHNCGPDPQSAGNRRRSGYPGADGFVTGLVQYPVDAVGR